MAVSQTAFLLLCAFPLVHMGSTDLDLRKIDEACNGSPHLLTLIKLVNVSSSSRKYNKDTYVYDGDGKSFTHSNHGELRPWLQIELSTRVHVTQVLIKNRADGNNTKGFDCAFRTLCDNARNGGCNLKCNCTTDQFEKGNCGMELRVGDSECVRENSTNIQNIDSHLCRVNRLAKHVRWEDGLVTPPFYNASFSVGHVAGRYLDIILPGSNRTLSLSEVDVYGCEVSSTSTSTTSLSTTSITSSTLSTVSYTTKTSSSSTTLTWLDTTTSSETSQATKTLPLPDTNSSTLNRTATTATTTQTLSQSRDIEDVYTFSSSTSSESTTLTSSSIESKKTEKSWVQKRLGVLILLVLTGIVILSVFVVLFVRNCGKKEENERDDIQTVYMAAQHNVDQIMQENEDDELAEYPEEDASIDDNWDIIEDKYEDNFESSV
eukprot:m.121136 g.121136  ORF g.121136 m.121136 type:complete len:433 (-) comp14381_c0_seq1:152-1450(-)